MDRLDAKISPVLHQVIGASLGIIFCAWWLEATPSQVAVIRLPATLILTVYFAVTIFAAARRVIGKLAAR